MNETLIFLLPLLTIGVLVWSFIRYRRSRKPKTGPVDDRTRQQRSVWAWAKILSSNVGPVSSFGMAHVELQLEVHTPGTPPYSAKTTWLVEKEALGYVENGKEISLKVDPLGLQHVYPNGSWAKFVK
jgi:hypothetical protein